MKTETFYRMRVGDLLTLKPGRKTAYGMNNGTVKLERIAERKGYLTPWIVAIDANGAIGHYMPSDFNKWEAA